MVSNPQPNLLYLADSLPVKFPSSFKRLDILLTRLNIEWRFLPGTKDIWARDYMPIQIDKDKFVQFIYDPGYLKNYQETISDAEEICKAIGIQSLKSTIKLDGGNIIKNGEIAILTNGIFKENSDWDKVELIKQIELLLEVKQIIIIPSDPSDFTGHVDGMVRFVDDKTVLINKYNKTDQKLGNAIRESLDKAGLNFLEIPYNPYQNKSDMDAKGIYMNFLQIGNNIIVPVFEMQEDDSTIKLFESIFPDNQIKALLSIDLAKYGGILNCISWPIYS